MGDVLLFHINDLFFPLCAASQAEFHVSKVHIRKCRCRGEFSTVWLKVLQWCKSAFNIKRRQVIRAVLGSPSATVHSMLSSKADIKRSFHLVNFNFNLVAVFPNGKIKCPYPLLPTSRVRKLDLLKCFCSKTNQHSEWSDVGVRLRDRLFFVLISSKDF